MFSPLVHHHNKFKVNHLKQVEVFSGEFVLKLVNTREISRK